MPMVTVTPGFPSRKHTLMHRDPTCRPGLKKKMMPPAKYPIDMGGGGLRQSRNCGANEHPEFGCPNSQQEYLSRRMK
jgi:hypothetical protein